MRLLLLTVFSAAALFLSTVEVAAYGEERGAINVTGWWVPQKAITGFNMSVSGNKVQITPTTATLEGAPAGTIRLTTQFAVAAPGATSTCIVAECSGAEFQYATSQENSWMFRRHFERSVADTDSYNQIAWSDPEVAFDTIGRQPRLTNKWPAPTGYVSVIDLVDQMNPQPNAQQLEALKQYAESEPLVPGNTYVTLVLEFNITSWLNGNGAYTISKAIITFEPDGNAILDNLNVCPPGTTGVPPDCVPKEEPPPAAAQPQRDCIDIGGATVCSDPGCPPPALDGTRWIQTENGCQLWTPPRGCPTCGPVDPNLRFRLIR